MTDIKTALAGTGLAPTEILLPRAGVDAEKWAVIACDQFTSQPEYWDAAERIVGDSPSALRVTLPEIYLPQAEARIPQVNAAMQRYLAEGVLEAAVHGMALVRRETSGGTRTGLVAAIDLECYDYTAGSRSPVRATEGTIISRLPPRVAIRSGAALELPHILVLVDDPEKTLIEPLAARAASLRSLYSFDLMLDGGHIEGWAVESEKDLAAVAEAVRALADPQRQQRRYGAADMGAFTFAVGDGNHSLATAKAVWEQKKPTLSPEQRENDPARYALVELNNLHDPSLVFEPIHRVLMGVDAARVLDDFADWARAQSGGFGAQSIRCVCADGERMVEMPDAPHGLPVGSLQLFLDEYIKQLPGAELDYIHDDDALRSLAAKSGAVGFMLEGIDKDMLFMSILRSGPLPRKTFSMGHARDKRYYMEARRIK